ncbi:hypothetical protein NNO_0790 [Hydrogenimonas sp.]|nr:hypothetical protein NNO_0790 [Hydrogenimonas sp.]
MPKLLPLRNEAAHSTKFGAPSDNLQAGSRLGCRGASRSLPIALLDDPLRSFR